MLSSLVGLLLGLLLLATPWQSEGAKKSVADEEVRVEALLSKIVNLSYEDTRLEISSAGGYSASVIKKHAPASCSCNLY